MKNCYRFFIDFSNVLLEKYSVKRRKRNNGILIKFAVFLQNQQIQTDNKVLISCTIIFIK